MLSYIYFPSAVDAHFNWAQQFTPSQPVSREYKVFINAYMYIIYIHERGHLQTNFVYLGHSDINRLTTEFFPVEVTLSLWIP